MKTYIFIIVISNVQTVIHCLVQDQLMGRDFGLVALYNVYFVIFGYLGGKCQFASSVPFQPTSVIRD